MTMFDYLSIPQDGLAPEYPPNCTIKERIGFDQELTVDRDIAFYGAVTFQSTSSLCNDPELWRDKRGYHSDHRIGSQLGESKSWETSRWEYPVNMSHVKQINDRFRDDDPDHEREWILFIAELSGFSDRMIELIEADHIIEVGRQVTTPYDLEAHRQVLHRLFQIDGISLPDKIVDAIARVLSGNLGAFPTLLSSLDDSLSEAEGRLSPYLKRARIWAEERMRGEVARVLEQLPLSEAFENILERVLSKFGLDRTVAPSFVIELVADIISRVKILRERALRAGSSRLEGLLDKIGALSIVHSSGLSNGMERTVCSFFARILSSVLSKLRRESGYIFGSGVGNPTTRDISGGKNKGPPPPAEADQRGNEQIRASPLLERMHISRELDDVYEAFAEKYYEMKESQHEPEKRGNRFDRDSSKEPDRRWEKI